MNYNETLETLTDFYRDCVRFWMREGKSIDNALRDVENITTNPYSPNGELLDVEAKNDFIAYIKEVWGWINNLIN